MSCSQFSPLFIVIFIFQSPTVTYRRVYVSEVYEYGGKQSMTEIPDVVAEFWQTTPLYTKVSN